MSKNTMQVEVTLMPVITSVIAEPGDLLMVLNGICIGVNTASPRREAVKVPSTPMSVPVRPPTADYWTKKSKPSVKRRKRKSPDHAFTTKLRAQIVEVVVKEAPHPLIASEICSRLPDAARTALGNMPNYGNLGRSLNYLVKYQILKRLPGRQYVLADPAITGIAEDRHGWGGAIVITAVKNGAADKPVQRARSAA